MFVGNNHENQLCMEAYETLQEQASNKAFGGKTFSSSFNIKDDLDNEPFIHVGREQFVKTGKNRSNECVCIVCIYEKIICSSRNPCCSIKRFSKIKILKDSLSKANVVTVLSRSFNVLEKRPSSKGKPNAIFSIW